MNDPAARKELLRRSLLWTKPVFALRESQLQSRKLDVKLMESILQEDIPEIKKREIALLEANVVEIEAKLKDLQLKQKEIEDLKNQLTMCLEAKREHQAMR